MTSTQTRDLLLTNKAFAALTPAALSEVVAVSTPQRIAAGEVILAEGDTCCDLFLLLSGRAHAVRKDAEGVEVRLNEVTEGDCLGELAFLDGGARSASIKAADPCETVRIEVGEIKNPATEAELKAALATVVVRRVRSLSNEMLEAMREQLEARERQNQFGHILLFTIAIFAISTTLLYLVAEDYVDDVYDPGFSWQTVLAFSLPCIAIIRYLKIPLAQLGIRREGAWRATWESVLLCSVLSVPAAIYLLFISEPTPPEDRPVQINTLFLLQYFAHTVVQELGARGLMQGMFVRFLADERGHRAVFLTSTIFASLHITFGIDAVVLTFFVSFLFGYVYLRHQNLIGVIIVHYWLGVMAALMVAF